MNKIAALFIILVIAAGCSGKSNIEPPTELEDFTPGATLKKIWSRGYGAPTGKKYITLKPYLDANVIYVSDIEGRVSAYDTDKGRRLWRKKLKKPVSGGVGYGAGLVLLGTEQGEVIALDRKTGEEKWTARVSSEVLARPVADAGAVVVQSNDGGITALSAETGKRLWVQRQSVPSLSLRGTSPPVIIGDAVFSGFANGRIAAYALKDGRLLWEITVSHPRGRSEIERLVDVDVPPLLLGKTLFAAGYQGKIVAMDTQSGRLLWSRDTSTYSGMTADASRIYLSDEHGAVMAFDRRTGVDVWKQEKLRARWPNAPALVGGYIAVGDFEGYVHLLSREDGQFVARYRIGSEAIRAPILASGNNLYVSTQDGDLAALRIQ